MKKDKNKIKEPYNPQHTPPPPQIIDPSQRQERGEDDKPVENRGTKPEKSAKDAGRSKVNR